MRVAHIITRLIIGGAQENTLFNCADLIQDYGDDVLLITGPGIGPEGSLEGQARQLGVPLAVLPELRRNIHPLRDWQSYRSIKRTLRVFRPEVVHTHSGKTGLLGRMAATALRVPAVVHTVHGAPFHPYQSRGAQHFFQFCERYAARRCHAMISVADAMTQLMLDANIAPPEMFTTIYSGMDVEPFLQANERREEVRARFGFHEDDLVVGKIARLFHLKGHEDVIAAARLVIEQYPQLQFLLVGDGLLRPQLEAQIAEAGLSNHFHFTGLVPPQQIPELIGAMDLVVHASLREGLARVLPQALIAGKPVISYDIDGAREVVLPGETGYLLAPRDVAAMAQALAELASDAALRERLGDEGQARFTEQFRHQTMTAQIRALYERLLAQAGRTSNAEGTVGVNRTIN